MKRLIGLMRRLFYPYIFDGKQIRVRGYVGLTTDLSLLRIKEMPIGNLPRKVNKIFSL